MTDRRANRRAAIVTRLLPIVERLLESGPVSYPDLRVETIIREADMARSTFYRYFQDKNELLIALSEPALADILAAAKAPWLLPPGATREELAAEMRRTVETYRPHVTLMTALAEASAYDPAVKAQFTEGFETVRAAVAGHIEQGQASGAIRPDLPADETAGWVTWMAERGMAQMVPGASQAQLDRISDAITAIVWYTFYDG